ncbi:MAG TPA: hypothetical protein HPP77_11910 [Candidatus Hydrogenedentes bacterium]|nr:hypothetical protein [Candidatus Hydrogenedentota bacterium]HIJ73291.1 hypothetical protein [Candidatus Hydrogenedentota bacterium]
MRQDPAPQMDLLWILDYTKWLEDEEQIVAEMFLTDMERWFTQCQVEVTPLMVLCVEEILINLTVARRIEATFAENPSLLAPAKNGAAPTVIPAVDAAAKARERARKAMKELEEFCKKAGTPLDKGVAAAVQPLLKKGQGVLQDAIAFEAKRQNRKKTPAKPKGADSN